MVRDEQVLLLEQTARGDVEAFHALYTLANRRLYSIILRILRDHALAEDALQEAFLKVWRKAARYDPLAGAPLAWMAVIARNTALDFARSVKPHVELNDSDLEDLSVETADPPDARLEASLKELPAEQANALVLIHTYGFSHSELAAHLGVPLGTVKSWVRRGTESLRIQLGV